MIDYGNQGYYDLFGDQKMKNEDLLNRASGLIGVIFKHHGAGGHWHVVIDDENVGDNFVRFAIDYTNRNKDDGSPKEQIDAEIELGKIFLRLTEDERQEAIDRVDVFGIVFPEYSRHIRSGKDRVENEK